MSRYHRVNIDGQSLYKTETRLTAEALQPGTFAVINGDDEFEQAAGVVGRLYVIESAYHEGLRITEAVPIDHSAVGNYVEEGREFAVRMAAGSYTKDQPVTVSASGLATAIPATPGDYSVIGYIQDEVTTTGVDFIRIRIRASTVTVAA